MMDPIYIGVDVAKRVAQHLPSSPWFQPNRKHAPSIRSFARAAARDGVWVTFEASGGYDRVLRDGLETVQARDFARALGVIGKTDRVDVRMRATFGQRLQPRRTPPVFPTRQALLAQIIRRRQLVEMRKQEAALRAEQRGC